MFEYSLVGGLVASGADAYLLHVTTTPSVAYVVRTEGFECGIMISASHNPYYDKVGGLVASGADAYLLHVTTTPSVAYVVRTEGFECGIMISASHNPYYDNGIKLINGFGEKMDESVIALVEAYLDGHLEAFGKHWDQLPLAKRDQIGRTVDHVAGRNRYIGYLISLGMYSFKGIKVGLDCANGSAWNIAKSVFDALGAKSRCSMPWGPRPTSSTQSRTATTSTKMPAPPISRACSDW